MVQEILELILNVAVGATVSTAQGSVICESDPTNDVLLVNTGYLGKMLVGGTSNITVYLFLFL